MTPEFMGQLTAELLAAAIVILFLIKYIKTKFIEKRKITYNQIFMEFIYGREKMEVYYKNKKK
jgi:hypothetical protein